MVQLQRAALRVIGVSRGEEQRIVAGYIHSKTSDFPMFGVHPEVDRLRKESGAESVRVVSPQFADAVLNSMNWRALADYSPFPVDVLVAFESPHAKFEMIQIQTRNSRGLPSAFLHVAQEYRTDESDVAFAITPVYSSDIRVEGNSCYISTPGDGRAHIVHEFPVSRGFRPQFFYKLDETTGIPCGQPIQHNPMEPLPESMQGMRSLVAFNDPTVMLVLRSAVNFSGIGPIGEVVYAHVPPISSGVVPTYGIVLELSSRDLARFSLAGLQIDFPGANSSEFDNCLRGATGALRYFGHLQSPLEDRFLVPLSNFVDFFLKGMYSSSNLGFRLNIHNVTYGELILVRSECYLALEALSRGKWGKGHEEPLAQFKAFFDFVNGHMTDEQDHGIKNVGLISSPIAGNVAAYLSVQLSRSVPDIL